MLVPQDPVPSDLECSHVLPPLPISAVAASLGILEDELEMYGKMKAKVSHLLLVFDCFLFSNLLKVNLSAINRLKDSKKGFYVVLTGITPTPLGEGKSTTAVGLGQVASSFFFFTN